MLDEETLTTLMDNETWLTAQECYDYGLCDQVGEDKSVAAKFDLNTLSNYRNTPINYVLRQVKNNEKVEKKESVASLEDEKRAILEDLELI